ncbi:MAG: CinA family protein, partial [Clostridia bacterium]|nr:CinA family protein [Clostridia bacterium]MDY6184436.1 CinA family protein [Eubacteriales bacterium]
MDETKQSPEERVVARLIERGQHISFAESCTAGLCAARLVNVANASRVFDASFVTYANEAKIKYLGVSADTIAKYGVV